nr:uncharacterized protein LOC118970938 isoform X2 [Manis javanica]
MRRLRAHSEPCLVTGDYAHAAPRSSTRLLRGSPHCEQRFRQLFPERPSLASSRPPERPGRLREASSGPRRLARLPRTGATETSAPGAAQVCARTMGAALRTGARPVLLRRQACGASRCWTPCASARGCHSKPGPARPVPLKKRGYDVTRNPHLNKNLRPIPVAPLLCWFSTT